MSKDYAGEAPHGAGHKPGHNDPEKDNPGQNNPPKSKTGENSAGQIKPNQGPGQRVPSKE